MEAVNAGLEDAV